MTTSSQKDIINDILSAMQCYPENEAFIIDDKHYTYAQLGEITASITHSLSEIKDEKIGIVAENRIETYAAILAVLAGGKTYVILHPAYPEERNLKIAALAGLRTLLCTSDTDRSAFGTGHFRIIDTDRLPGKTLSEQQSHSSDEERNAYIIFTSGSTGEPKGVPITRANLNAFYRAYSSLDWNLDEHDRMLQMFELTFDVSVVSLLYPLTLGAAVYTVGHQDVKHFKVFELLEKYQLTFATVTPSLLQLLSPYFDEINLPSLKYLGVSAEASQTELLERFRKSAPNATFINLYGPTEATIYCTCYRIPASDKCKHYNGMVAIGKPFPGIRAVIADEEGNELPQGETGELWVSGRQVMKGYLDDPEKSALVLIHRPDGQIYYRTGDLCILDGDGDIIYCGRKDYQVKIQGFRIELSEIEYTAQSFFKTPCSVAAVPLLCDGICNELHLAVETTECTQSALIEYLKEKLPKYMLPKQIHCISQFPVTNSNKTDRKKIAELIKEKKL